MMESAMLKPATYGPDLQHLCRLLHIMIDSIQCRSTVVQRPDTVRAGALSTCNDAYI